MDIKSALKEIFNDEEALNYKTTHSRFWHIVRNFLICCAICAIHRQHQTGLFGKQGKYDFGNDIKVKGELGKEPLDTPQIGISVPTVGHGRSELVKADSLHHTERVKHKGHQLYSCQIHCFSKMLLHNWEDLVNFDQVLGSSNFHGEKRSNFSFKLLIFRDFCKFKCLCFRCLTTYF